EHLTARAHAFDDVVISQAGFLHRNDFVHGDKAVVIHVGSRGAFSLFRGGRTGLRARIGLLRASRVLASDLINIRANEIAAASADEPADQCAEQIVVRYGSAYS